MVIITQGILPGGRRRGGRGQHLGVSALRVPLQARQPGRHLRRQPTRAVRAHLAAASGKLLTIEEVDRSTSLSLRSRQIKNLSRGL